ncbi:MAG: hypothetical protein MPL62_16635, partial [Alphaproteobacteria bacterium]|nr:hypothetical protein [Alphaproteobacteria bacterium]
STFSGQSVEILPQTFTLDVDANNISDIFDVILIARYLTQGRDRIPNATLESLVVSATGKGDEIKTTISGGIDALDVDDNNITDVFDAILIARYLTQGRDRIPDATLEALVASATGKSTEIKAAIAALL